MLNFIARSLLAGCFVSGGLNQLQSPDKLAPVVTKAADSYGIPLPADAKDLVSLNGAGMVVAGTTLALGILPRTSAAALIGLLIPTTIVGHPYWTKESPGDRARSKSSFLANAAIVGGLLAVVVSKRNR